MPQPNPVAFTLFNIDIMWYAVCVCLGILAACTLAYFRAPKHNLDPDRLLNFMIISIPMGIIGARAYYVLFHWDWYAGDIMAIINIRQGGLAIHGGLILGLGTAAVLPGQETLDANNADLSQLSAILPLMTNLKEEELLQHTRRAD